MQIGVDLGWTGVRAVTVTARGEIISLPDAQHPEMIETAPVVAWTNGGILVGKAAIALAASALSRSPILPLGDSLPRHALADAARGNWKPLSMLLAKLARDLSDYGAPLDAAVFCVHPDLLTISDTEQNGTSFELAASAAGFENLRYFSRFKAVARYDAWRDSIDSSSPNSAPCTLIVDAGFRSLRVSSVAFDAASHFQEMAASNWLSSEEGIPEDYYGNFRQIIAKSDVFNEQHFCDLFTLERLWTLVRSPDAHSAAVVLDGGGSAHAFDITACRRLIAENIVEHLKGALDGADKEWTHPRIEMLKTGAVDALIVLAGEYASIPEVRHAVRKYLNNEWRTKGEFTYAAILPENAFAVAAALEVETGSLEEVTSVLKIDHSYHRWLLTRPINDGQLWDNPHLAHDGPAQEITSSGDTLPHSELVDPITLLDSALADRRLDDFQTANINDLGELLGSLWAVQVDRLLRRVATAPTPKLKAVYEKQQRDLGILPDCLDPVKILATFENSNSNRLKQSVVSKNFESFKVEGDFSQHFAQGFSNFTRTGNTAFNRYAAGERQNIVPGDNRLLLAYNSSNDSDAELRDRGLAVKDRLVVTTSPHSTALSDTVPTLTPDDALGVSSDGFRPLLASSFGRCEPVGSLREWCDDVSLFTGGRGLWSTMSWLGLVAFVVLISAASIPSVSAFLSEELSRKPEPQYVEFSEKERALSVVCTNNECKPLTSPGDFKITLPPALLIPSQGCYLAILRVFNPITKVYSINPPTIQSNFLDREKHIPAANALNTACKLPKGDMQLLVPYASDGAYRIRIHVDQGEVKNKALESVVKDNTLARNISLTKDGVGVVIQELVWTGWDASTITKTISLPANVYRIRTDPKRTACADEYVSLGVFTWSNPKEASDSFNRDLKRPVRRGLTWAARWLFLGSAPAAGQPVPKPKMTTTLEPLKSGDHPDLSPPIRAIFESETRLVGGCEAAP